MCAGSESVVAGVCETVALCFLVALRCVLAWDGRMRYGCVGAARSIAPCAQTRQAGDIASRHSTVPTERASQPLKRNL
jgi:hypothetical protein